MSKGTQGCIGFQAILQKPFTKTAQQNTLSLWHNQKASFPFKQSSSEYTSRQLSASNLQAILLANNVVLSPKINLWKLNKSRTHDFRTIPRSQHLDHGQVLCAPEKRKKLVRCISRADALSVKFPQRQGVYREVMARLATFLAPTSSSLCCTGSSSLVDDQRNSHRACNISKWLYAKPPILSIGPKETPVWHVQTWPSEIGI